MKKIIYPVLTLAWVALIFSFSLQPREDSSQLSSGFLNTLLETFRPGLLESLSSAQLDMLHFLVRKCAHFSEFAVLGMLSILTVNQKKFQHSQLFAIVCCVLVACIDETIQLFSGGRSARVADVVLDSVGGLVGIVLMRILITKRRQG